MNPDIPILGGVALLAAGGFGLNYYKKYTEKKRLTGFYEGPPLAPGANLLDPSVWYSGPHPYGESRSVGVPLHPDASPAGPTIALPVGNWDGPSDPINETDHSNTGGHLHALSINYGPLTGKKLIRAKIQVTVPDGVTVLPHTAGPGSPAMIGLYFQEKGDDWSAAGTYEDYRWYSSFDEIMPVVNGVFELTAPMDATWTATQTSTRAGDPNGFQKAVDNAQALGLTFGGGSGLSHGLYASGPGARLTILEFTVE